MRIYKVVFDKQSKRQIPYYGRKSVYHDKRHADAQAARYGGMVIQSTEFEWEE
jgi:hypothetical protein